VQVYFYDLTSKKLFTDASTKIPAIPAPSDQPGTAEPKGVRAFVFSCGDCKSEADRVVGWVETYSPEGQKKLAPLFGPDRPPHGPISPDEVPSLLDVNEHLVAAPSGEQWFDANSSEAQRIRQEAQKPCPSGERPQECRP
jgi:hypothetical protein